jgi:hypothetical protein
MLEDFLKKDSCGCIEKPKEPRLNNACRRPRHIHIVEPSTCNKCCNGIDR